MATPARTPGRSVEGEQGMLRATAILALLLLAGCATGPSPEYLAAKEQCGREMMRDVPRSEPLLGQGAYIELCMKQHGFAR
jgi:hypothetical protein